MRYINLSVFEKAINRVVPVPKKAEQLPGNGLQLQGELVLTAPQTQGYVLNTAIDRVQALFASRQGEKQVRVKLSLAEAPFEMRCADEGYCLSVTADGIDIVGYGEKGLLYGVITLEQLCGGITQLPALKITDWPESPTRGIKQESRYGSNLMEREDWMALLEDLVSKKLNTLALSFYGCWMVQYDNRVSEYLYMPVKKHPQLQTPMVVKYFSPKENRWIEYETLPPIFRDNLLEDIFRRARDLGIQIVPLWNSFGHNTLIPRLIPEVASVSEDGEPQMCGFCTSSQATYDLLFSIYDQIIDDYMIPYGMTAMSLGLDEVHESIGKFSDDVFKVRDPWCSCPACRNKEKGDRFIEHTVKLMAYLKKKGIKSVYMYCDMIQEGRRSKLGWLGDKLLAAAEAAGVKDTLVIDWWSYHDIPEKNWIKTVHPELGLRNVLAPWNGYHTWVLTLQPLGNVQLLAEVNKRDGGEGIIAYAMWDKSCDRTHEAVAEYSWGYEQAGTPKELTRRYALRNFGSRAGEAYRAYRLMDWALEQRYTKKWATPEKDYISLKDLMLYKLSPYNYSYAKVGMRYPRVFVDEALEFVLTMRNDVERALYTVSAMAREARAIFLDLAQAPDCDQTMALWQAYECENYQVLAEDWLALLEIYDLCADGDYPAIAAICHSRQQARLAVMARCEQTKDRFFVEAMAMRQHGIFLQLFADMAAYVENTPESKLDLMDLGDVLSDRSWWLR